MLLKKSGCFRLSFDISYATKRITTMNYCLSFNKIKLFSIILILSAKLWGCHKGTLEYTGEKLIAIQDLRAGDSVICLQKNATFVASKIQTQACAREPQPIVEIIFYGGEKVLVVEDQKFFLNQRNDWIAAHYLSIGDQVMRIDGSHCKFEDRMGQTRNFF